MRRQALPVHSTHMAATALIKAPTGIAGFDDMTGGGLPAGGITLVTGGPGSGKTIFALQTLVSGAAAGEPGIFVGFEERSERLLVNAATFSWNLRAARRKLHFLDAQLPADLAVTGDFDLMGLLAGLAARVAETGARRIVFDSLDVLLGLLGRPELALRELRRLQEWLAEHRLTAVLSAKAHPRTSEVLAPFNFLEFMVDCVVALEHVASEGVSHRSIRILKYRGSSFQENRSPMVIGRGGLEVASPLSRQLPAKLVFEERISTGVEGLDAMLTGGYYRASSILVSGAPGTAKSTLCGAFAEAACRRGEATLFVSFDSDPQEIVRNLTSVGIELARFRKNGLLTMHSSRANTSSAEVHLLTITCLARDHRVRSIVLDPISALGKIEHEPAGFGVAERLIDWAKHRGITVLCTSLLNTSQPDVESTAMQISTIADTWIHLSYVVHAGERNRALTIVKSRGTAHSNQVRELLLSKKGLALAEVYTAEGQVLMGTMRWQKERADRLAQEAQQRELQAREQALAREREGLAQRLAALEREVQRTDAELLALQRAQHGQRADEEIRRSDMLALRGSEQAALTAPATDRAPGRKSRGKRTAGA